MLPMRVLVTGADGFVGRHLVPFLRAAGHRVVETVLQSAGVERPEVRRLDVTDAGACRALTRDTVPTHVVHLAAVSQIRQSLDDPEATYRINVEGTRNVLEAARLLPERPRVLVIGSAEEYGSNPGQPLPELPVDALRPRSPYAASKVEVERLIERNPVYRRLAIRTRSFPHLGPGQSRGFFSADVASLLVEIEQGRRPPVLPLGNLDAVRDYSDVRDIVRAYVLLLERGTVGEVYNVCSGRGVRMQAVLEQMLAVAGVPARVEADPAKLRPSEIPVLIGDNAKLREAVGWKPQIPLEESLRDVIAWWRAAARAPVAQQSSG